MDLEVLAPTLLGVLFIFLLVFVLERFEPWKLAEVWGSSGASSIVVVIVIVGSLVVDRVDLLLDDIFAMMVIKTRRR